MVVGMSSDGRGNAPYHGPQPPYPQQAHPSHGYAPNAGPYPQHPYPPQQTPYGAPQGYAQAAPGHAHAGHAHAGHAHYGAPTTPISCPECGEMTTSLKHYTMMRYLVFVWFFAFWARKKETGCPACMRKAIAISAAINIVPANLLWLVVIAPWYSILFFMTFADGHSSEVHALLRE